MAHRNTTRMHLTEEFGKFLSLVRDEPETADVLKPGTFRNWINNANDGKPVLIEHVKSTLRKFIQRGIPIRRNFFDEANWKYVSEFEEDVSNLPWPSDEPGKPITLLRLAAREETLVDPSEIWIVLPRTLVNAKSDQERHAFLKAMQKNLRRNVSYVYFLPRTADIKVVDELVGLAQDLKKALTTEGDGGESVHSLMRCLLLDASRVGQLIHNCGVILVNARQNFPTAWEVLYDPKREPTGAIPLSVSDAKTRRDEVCQAVPGDPRETLGISILDKLRSDIQVERVIETITSANGNAVLEKCPWHDPTVSFSAPGTAHLHVDVAGNSQALANLRAILCDKSCEWKVSTIVAARFGPQKDDDEFRDTYTVHNLSPNNAQIDYFATLFLGSLPQPPVALPLPSHRKVRREAAAKPAILPAQPIPADMASRVSEVLNVMQNNAGVVIEVEQVVGRIRDGASDWRGDVLAKLQPTDVGGRATAETHDYEIHHGFDLPRRADQNAASQFLPHLVEACSNAGFPAGGWFVFGNPQLWCYRSNRFVGAISEEAAKKEHQAVQEAIQAKIAELGYSYRVRLKTVVERILGIWNILGSQRDLGGK